MVKHPSLPKSSAHLLLTSVTDGSEGQGLVSRPGVLDFVLLTQNRKHPVSPCLGTGNPNLALARNLRDIFCVLGDSQKVLGDC